MKNFIKNLKILGIGKELPYPGTQPTATTVF